MKDVTDDRRLLEHGQVGIALTIYIGSSSVTSGLFVSTSLVVKSITDTIKFAHKLSQFLYYEQRHC